MNPQKFCMRCGKLGQRVAGAVEKWICPHHGVYFEAAAPPAKTPVEIKQAAGSGTERAGIAGGLAAIDWTQASGKGLDYPGPGPVFHNPQGGPPKQPTVAFAGGYKGK
jgi:hypothetical protein